MEFRMESQVAQQFSFKAASREIKLQKFQNILFWNKKNKSLIVIS